MSKKKNNDLGLEEYEDGSEMKKKSIEEKPKKTKKHKDTKEESIIKEDLKDEKDVTQEESIIKEALKDEKEIIKDENFKYISKDDYYEDDDIKEENFVNDYLEEHFKEEKLEDINRNDNEEINYDDYEIEETTTGSDTDSTSKENVKKFYLFIIIGIVVLVIIFILLKFVIFNKNEEVVLKDKTLIEDISGKVDLLSTKKLDGKGSYYIKNLYSEKEVTNVSNTSKEQLIVGNLKYNSFDITDTIKKQLQELGLDINNSTNKLYISDKTNYKKIYLELFNEEKSPNTVIEDDCKTYYYIESTKQFILNNPCNTNLRSSINEDIYYKEQYTKKNDEIYVYVKHALKYCYTSNNKTTCGVNNGLKDGEKDILTITEDEYKTFAITEDNKDKFITYKFTFKKGKSDNYYFISEKILG